MELIFLVIVVIIIYFIVTKKSNDKNYANTKSTTIKNPAEAKDDDKNKTFQEIKIDNLDAMDNEYSSDDTYYEIFPDYSDKTININALRNGFKQYKKLSDVPKELKLNAIMKTKMFEDFDIGNAIPYRLFDMPYNSGDVSSKKEFNSFVLSMYEYIIGKYSNLPLDDRIQGIDDITSNTPINKKIRQRMFKDDLPSEKWLIFDLTQITGIGKATATKLYNNGIRNLDELKSVSDNELSKVCKKCIKIRNNL